MAACLLALTGGRGAFAVQARADRIALEQFRDSLAGVTDSATLTAAFRTAPAPADSAARAMLQLRRGFAELRVAELGNAARYRRAESAFAQAARLEPPWPYPRFGKALAKYGISESQRAEPRELGIGAGVGALDDAVAELAGALARESTFEPALAALDRVVERLNRPDFWRRALDAMRRAGAPARRTPQVLLGLGRIERQAGSVDSALAAFDAYLAAGGLPGLGRLEAARTRLAGGLPGGDSLYYAGAGYDDSATVRGYRNDIAVMLTDSQLAGFDAVHGAGRVAFLRRFWSDRDLRELRDTGERLHEHYRRLAYARKHFALTLTRRIYPLGCAYRTGSMEFDDRGVIYIRQGEPTKRVRTYLFDMMANESWRYARPDGDLLFHFGAGIGVDDYRVLSGVLDIYGTCAVSPIRTTVSSSDVYNSRAELDPMYGKLAAWVGTIRGAELAREERRIGAASIAVALGTDSYERRFARALPAAISLATLGTDGGRSLVHIVWGIAGEHLTGVPDDAGWRYPVRLRFVAYDSAGHVVAAADTTTVLETAAAVARGAMLFGRFVVPVPAGRWRYRLALQQGDSSGVVVPRDSLVVRRLVAPLAMSDPVLGWRAIALNWTRGGDTVFFSPFRSYFGATELELYYEVYGMTAGSTYQTDVLISERKGTRRTPAKVRLRFGGLAADGVTHGRRTIDLRQFTPGAYWLDLVVTDAAGRREQRRTWFEVKAR